MGSPRDVIGRTLDEGARESLQSVLIEQAVLRAPLCEECGGTGHLPWPPNADAAVIKQRGWSPKGAVCDACSGSGGRFTLSSGRLASYYVDASRISMGEPGFSALATLVAAEAWDRGCVQIGGVIAGGVPLAIAGSFGIRRYGRVAGRDARAFMVRDRAKGHGARNAVVGCPRPGPWNSLLVEDVVSTGRSVALALASCYMAGLLVPHVWALVDRGKGVMDELADCAENHNQPVPTYSYAFTMKDLGVEDVHESSESAA